MGPFRLGTTAVAILAALTVPAQAAGPTPAPATPVVAAPPAPPAPSDWSGFYAGGQLGWGWLSGDARAGDLDGDGAIGGVTGGYRRDLGRLVVGGEVQYDWSDIALDYGDDDAAGDLEALWRVKGLAGYDAGQALIYGSVGWARASGEALGDDFDGDGWVVGAGVDYRLNDRLSLGGELMRHRFDDLGDGTADDLDATTFQGRITFRF